METLVLLNHVSIAVNHYLYYIQIDRQVLLQHFDKTADGMCLQAWDITGFVSHNTPSPSA